MAGGSIDSEALNNYIKSRQADMTGFTECATCAAKPGSPYLCISCLSNRERISTLRVVSGKLEKQNKILRSYVQDMADAGGFVGAAAKGVLEDCNAICR